MLGVADILGVVETDAVEVRVAEIDADADVDGVCVGVCDAVGEAVGLCTDPVTVILYVVPSQLQSP